MLVTLVQLAKYTASLVQYSSVNLLRFQKPKMGRTLHNHMRQLHSEGTSSDPFRSYVHFICDVVEEGIWFSRWDEPNIAEKPVYLAFDCWANSLGTCFAPVKPDVLSNSLCNNAVCVIQSEGILCWYYTVAINLPIYFSFCYILPKFKRFISCDNAVKSCVVNILGHLWMTCEQLMHSTYNLIGI